jgi:hypothetical protein
VSLASAYAATLRLFDPSNVRPLHSSTTPYLLTSFRRLIDPTFRPPDVPTFNVPTLFLSLFVSRAFRKPFAINRFRTLSKNCRVSPASFPTFLKNCFNFGGISRRINHVRGTTPKICQTGLPNLPTLNLQLSFQDLLSRSSGAADTPILRSSSP